MDTITVYVERLLPFGLLVRLEDGREGLIRERELAWSGRELQRWRERFKPGDRLQAVLLAAPDEARLELSLRLAEHDPWLNLVERYPLGALVDGSVTGVQPYGAFIELEPGMTGLLHQSRLPASAQTRPIHELFWVGDRVRVIVERLDTVHRQIGLSLLRASAQRWPRDWATLVPDLPPARHPLPAPAELPPPPEQSPSWRVVEDLERALKRVVAKHAIARYTSDARRTEIEWSDGGQSLASLRQSLMEDKRYVPEDEANDLIGRLFVDAQRVVLVPIVDEQLPSDAPLASTTSPNLRRETRIFLIQVDHQPARLVLKLGKRQKIEREVQNYGQHVRDGLGGLFRPEMRDHKQLWNMGGVIYGLVGNAEVSSSDGPHSFSQFYRTEHDPVVILQPLQHFFHRQHWGRR